MSTTNAVVCSKPTFQRENWASFWKDWNGPILQRHYEELALDKDSISPSFDAIRYEELEKHGNLHLVTIRVDGHLVGYFVNFLMKHLHYDQAGLMAYTDFYYVVPEWRRGGMGAKLVTFVQEELRKLGAVKHYLSCKVHQDHSALFKMLGYKPSDLMFTKLL